MLICLRFGMASSRRDFYHSWRETSPTWCKPQGAICKTWCPHWCAETMLSHGRTVLMPCRCLVLQWCRAQCWCLWQHFGCSRVPPVSVPSHTQSPATAICTHSGKTRNSFAFLFRCFGTINERTGQLFDWRRWKTVTGYLVFPRCWNQSFENVSIKLSCCAFSFKF